MIRSKHENHTQSLAAIYLVSNISERTPPPIKIDLSFPQVHTTLWWFFLYSSVFENLLWVWTSSFFHSMHSLNQLLHKRVTRASHSDFPLNPLLIDETATPRVTTRRHSSASGAEREPEQHAAHSRAKCPLVYWMETKNWWVLQLEHDPSFLIC